MSSSSLSDPDGGVVGLGVGGGEGGLGGDVMAMGGVSWWGSEPVPVARRGGVVILAGALVRIGWVVTDLPLLGVRLRFL